MELLTINLMKNAINNNANIIKITYQTKKTAPHNLSLGFDPRGQPGGIGKRVKLTKNPSQWLRNLSKFHGEKGGDVIFSI